MEIFKLLQEYGIEADQKDWEQAEEVVDATQPIRFENNVAVFTSEQVAMYGSPDLFGYPRFLVVELDQTSSPYVVDWKFEQDRERPRPIHRYNRVERFEFTLAQLLGLRGDVPSQVMAVMQYADKTPEKCWNSIRSILKHYRYRKFYNRIPQIMFRLGLGSVFTWDGKGDTYREIVNDFRKLQHIFETKKKREEWNRKYFPPLRFIAIKLLEKHGATCNFDIAFIRTKRKQKLLTNLWNTFS